MAFFAFLAAICVAAPVLAETPAPEGEATDPLELQRDESLETPQAAAEREGSEFAYAGLTAGQEETLLQNAFATQLGAIDADPARALADVVIERIDSPTQALVSLEGEKALLESDVPLRAPEEDGDLHKVELDLEETPDGYEPANPLVDLDLPDSAQDPIGVGDEGLALTPVGAAGAPAKPIGDEDLLLPAAHEDTSLLLSPIARGLELSAMLASRNSPQQLSFDVSLPQGATLRPAESGGAEVVGADGEPVAAIGEPHAVDAQGTEVPAALAVEGDTLSIVVPHQELDVAYPLFVDPPVEELWPNFTDPTPLSYWHWSWSGVAGAEDYIGRTSCIVTCWGNGLYVRARSNFTYPAGSWGRWWFTPQGSTTYMRKVVLDPIRYDAHGCGANEPHGYVGVWNDYSGWVVRSNAFPSGWLTSLTVDNLPVGSRTAFVGIHADSSSKLSCGRDYQLGGASLYLEDPEYPTPQAPYGYPGGWIKNGASFTISAPATDPGLGVYSATLNPKGSPPVEKKQGCNGHYSSPCPGSYTFQFPTSAASFDEGEKGVDFSVNDPLGKSTTYAWNMKVDRGPPEIELAGQLAQATGETEGDAKDSKDKPLPLPVYNLTVNATDGVLNPADGSQKRSGVKKIEVFIDNRSTPEQTWEASSCAAGNCPLSKVFVLKLNELSPDADHYLRVLATDFAGNAPRERKLEFEYIPATGMKDEYVMQYFPLPDGSGDEAEEEHPARPELAVNLVSGNLAYRQQDLDVEGPAADLGLDLFYNSLLPESQNTEWGDGWTLSQTPELEIEGGGGEATIVEDSGAVESKVDLPASVGEVSFDKRLQATVEKVAGGGYELTDESGETGETVAFGPSGRAEEQTNGTATTVDYSYEGGDLSAIAVEDPGTAKVDPESLDEDKAYPNLAISHSANFGSYGSADGQLKAPADVAANRNGYLWVLDRNNSRLQRFGPDGQFVSKFGVAGSGQGQINNPTALAVDGAGNVLVAELGRVQKFSPSGQFLSGFGSFGWENGQLFFANGIAIAKDGSVWVSDDSRVQRFTAAGQFIERVGVAGEGKIGAPQSVAAGPEGNVYVADVEKDRVVVFDSNGDYVRAFGSSGPGQLSEPVEVALDSAGNAWVADAQTDGVGLFNTEGDYVKGFGSSGSGTQQFAFEAESGLAADRGRVWVVDGTNNRLSRWLAAPITSALHSAGFGTNGSADGELKDPADVAIDDAGDLWVLDRTNGRVQRFGPDGQFVSKFGTPGSGEGQLNNPAALALDGAGNVLVAELGRVQKFSPAGQLLAKFGSFGTGNGELFFATGIAVGVDGTIWVADESRVQRFSASGQFLERIGASGAGQLGAPRSLDVDSRGAVFVADAEADRIKVFDLEGDYLRQFGATGTGPGQLSQPVEIDVDPEENVWVADSQTDRVQLFDAAGDYIARFGEGGAGAQQFEFASEAGIAAAGGRIWVADGASDRVAEWVGGNYEASSEPALTEDDPQIEVDVSEGLVDTVEGEESGTIDYDHSGDLLTAVDSDDGEATFSYDSAGRMTKVTLSNGTYGEIAYEATYGRVKSVTVAVEGKNPKTTYFSWSDEPRRTTVTPPDAPATTYEIAADGSIFKWWNAKQPPVFDAIAGTLYDPNNRETATPIPTGVHNLVIQAHDDEGVASIQVIANNNQLVDEHTCTYDPGKPTECVTETDEWVTETANWPPGIVYFEVIATDRLGEASSQRFWVNIPYTPPPDPEAEEPPRFNDILEFREEFGLDLDLKGDEMAINDRIFDLMGAWNSSGTPEGEVARATMEKWGVPLRQVDVAEMEYREWYLARNVPLIEEWAEANRQNTFAGYYMDHRAGGIMHVGFTAAQAGALAEIKEQVPVGAPERLAVYPSEPTVARASLDSVLAGVEALWDSEPLLGEVLVSSGIDEESNTVEVTGTDVSLLDSHLRAALGQQAPLTVKYEEQGVEFAGRNHTEGRIRAGDRLIGQKSGGFTGCTAGFGAWDRVGTKPNGDSEIAPFVLTAGHCAPVGRIFYRQDSGGAVDPANLQKIGHSARTGMPLGGQEYETDGSAIELNGGGLMPYYIYVNGRNPKPVGSTYAPKTGETLCFSGVKTNARKCGEFIGVRRRNAPGPGKQLFIITRFAGLPGDSGAPVWSPGTGRAVGLVSGGPNGTGLIKDWVTPLVVPRRQNPDKVPGILKAPGMKSLHLAVPGD